MPKLLRRMDAFVFVLYCTARQLPPSCVYNSSIMTQISGLPDLRKLQVALCVWYMNRRKDSKQVGVSARRCQLSVSLSGLCRKVFQTSLETMPLIGKISIALCRWRASFSKVRMNLAIQWFFPSPASIASQSSRLSRTELGQYVAYEGCLVLAN